MTTVTTADHDAAKRLASTAGLAVPPWQLEHIAAALAEARAAGHAAALDPFAALFAGGPDTPCRTTWRRPPGHSLPGNIGLTTECVEVPVDELRAAFDEAERALCGAA